jgi:hypothetical protein
MRALCMIVALLVVVALSSIICAASSIASPMCPCHIAVVSDEVVSPMVAVVYNQSLQMDAVASESVITEGNVVTTDVVSAALNPKSNPRYLNEPITGMGITRILTRIENQKSIADGKYSRGNNNV